MTTAIGRNVTLDCSLDDAIDRATEALKVEGFGVLTRIDVKATLKEKLGVDFRPYVILGACNPPLAHRGLSKSAEFGLLMPCNVTVERTGDGKSLVRLGDPQTTFAVGPFAEDPEIRDVARDASERVERVATALERAAVS